MSYLKYDDVFDSSFVSQMQEMEIALGMREWGNVYRLVGCLILAPLTRQALVPSIIDAHAAFMPISDNIWPLNPNSTSFEDLLLLRKEETEQRDGGSQVEQVVKNGEMLAKSLEYILPLLSPSP